MLFVAQFLLRSPIAKLTQTKLATLRDTELGCIVLRCLPDDFKHRLRPLISQPRRVIEHLLMTKHTDLLEAVRAQLPKPAWLSLIQVPAGYFTKDEAKKDGKGVPKSSSKTAVFEHDLLSYYAEKAVDLSSWEQEEAAGEAPAAPQADMDESQYTDEEMITGLDDSFNMSFSGRAVPRSSWAQDGESPTCVNCKKHFTLTRRRHHCRHCGKVVCHECSMRRARHPEFAAPVRICDDCFFKALKTSNNLPESTSTFNKRVMQQQQQDGASINSVEATIESDGKEPIQLYKRVTTQKQVLSID